MSIFRPHVSSVQSRRSIATAVLPQVLAVITTFVAVIIVGAPTPSSADTCSYPLVREDHEETLGAHLLQNVRSTSRKLIHEDGADAGSADAKDMNLGDSADWRRRNDLGAPGGRSSKSIGEGAIRKSSTAVASRSNHTLHFHRSHEPGIVVLVQNWLSRFRDQVHHQQHEADGDPMLSKEVEVACETIFFIFLVFILVFLMIYSGGQPSAPPRALAIAEANAGQAPLRDGLGGGTQPHYQREGRNAFAMRTTAYPPQKSNLNGTARSLPMTASRLTAQTQSAYTPSFIHYPYTPNGSYFASGKLLPGTSATLPQSLPSTTQDLNELQALKTARPSPRLATLDRVPLSSISLSVPSEEPRNGTTPDLELHREIPRASSLQTCVETLCPQLVVPDEGECRLILPRVEKNMSREIVCTVDDSRGIPVFQVAFTKSTRGSCLALSSTSGEVLYATAREQINSGRKTLSIFNYMDKPYGVLEINDTKFNSCKFIFTPLQGERIIFVTDAVLDCLDAKSGDGRPMATMEPFEFRTLRDRYPVIIGPTVDAGLMVTCILGVNWLINEASTNSNNA